VLKLLLVILSALLTAVCLLQLRQQKVILNHQTQELHRKINDSQAELWNQQLQVAAYTAPNAITATVNALDVPLVPDAPVELEDRRSWIDVAEPDDPMPAPPPPTEPASPR
jgi:cell division protein FtsL